MTATRLTPANRFTLPSPPSQPVPSTFGHISNHISNNFAPLTHSVTLSNSPFGGLGSILTVVIAYLAILATLSMVGILVIVIVANRAEPDPTGRRPQSVYYFAVAFLTLLSALLGSTAVVAAVVNLIGHHHGTIDNTIARISLFGGLVTVMSLGIFSLHLRRGRELAAAGPDEASPSRRVGQSYVAAASFTSIMILLFDVIVSGYLLVSLTAPGVFGSLGGRGMTLRILAIAAYLGGFAFTILRSHRKLLSPRLHFFAPSSAPTLPSVVDPSAEDTPSSSV